MGYNRQQHCLHGGAALHTRLLRRHRLGRRARRTGLLVPSHLRHGAGTIK